MKNFIEVIIPNSKESIEVDINKISYDITEDTFSYDDELEKKVKPKLISLRNQRLVI